MSDPLLQDVAEVPIQPATPPLTPLAQPRSHSLWWLWTVLVFVVAGAGFGGWWWLSHRSVIIPVRQLADPAKPVNLAGLDQAQPVKGSCIASYQVNSLGTGADGTGKFALSISLVGNPSDAVALAKLLQTAACATELKTITDAIHAKLVPTVTATTSDQFSTSFKTKSGQRLFLP